MPTHRAAGSVLDAGGEAVGSVELATTDEWEGFLRSRAGWATAPVPVVPAHGARRTGPMPAVTAFVPSQRSACPPARPAAPAPAPAPAAPVVTGAAAATAFLPAQRAAEPGSSSRPGRPRGRRAQGAPDATAPDAALAEVAAPPAAEDVAEVPAVAPLRSRSGRRRADLPVDAAPVDAAPPAPPAPPASSALAEALLPAAFLAEVPAAFLSELAGTDEPLPARRARRRAPAPLDAAPSAPLPVRPGGRRAQRLAATDDRSTPRPVPRPTLGIDSLTWAEQVEADDAVLLQLEQALTMPSAERAWTPSALPSDLPRPRSGEPLVLPPVPPPATPRVERAAGAATAAEAAGPQDVVAPAFTPARGRSAHRLPARALSVLPQVGVVGVLGLATFVAPMVGDLLPAGADADTATTARTGATLSAAPASAASALVETGGARQLSSAAKVAAEGAQALVDGRSASRVVSRASTRAQLAQQQAEVKAAADATAAKVAAAAAAVQHHAQVEALAPGCDGATPDTTGERNGRLPDSQLCSLSWEDGHRLRSDAAVALAELDLAYREHFGTDISLTDTYRSYSEQVRVRREKPSLAARPGTSEHGWGLAMDMGGGVQNSDEHYDWLIENAPKYGWDHPAWARKGGAGPYEPWHWEYVAGEA